MKIINHILFYFLTITVATAQQYHAQNTDKINVFVQPNDSTLAWYGSGDVNQDNQLDWNDYNKMVSEAPQIDEADIDGDGVPSTNNDKQVLANYFNGNIGYLPAHWNKLETRQERIDWLDKMLAIDQTDTITYSYPDWISGDYAVQTSLNFKGHNFVNQEEKEFVSEKFDTTAVGRFNLPVDHTVFSAPGIGHGQNGINVENNAKNPEHYVYPDQQERGPENDLRILGDNWNPPSNSLVSINKLGSSLRDSQDRITFYTHNLVDFRSGDDAVLNLYSYNPNVIETREQAIDETYPILNLSGVKNDSTYNPNYTSIDINVLDEYFDRTGYSLNNSDTTWFSTQDTSVYLNSQLGNNELLVIAEDKAGNQTLEKRTYITDSNVAVEDEKGTPQNYTLGNNYPNPFNPTTQISYELPQESEVELTIYNSLGEEVNTLVNKEQTVGKYTINWSGQNSHGELVPGGIYFYTLRTKKFTQTKKMLFLR